MGWFDENMPGTLAGMAAMRPMPSHAPTRLNPPPQIPLGKADRIGPARRTLKDLAAMPTEQRQRLMLRQALDGFNAGTLEDLGAGLMGLEVVPFARPVGARPEWLEKVLRKAVRDLAAEKAPPEAYAQLEARLRSQMAAREPRVHY